MRSTLNITLDQFVVHQQWIDVDVDFRLFDGQIDQLRVAGDGDAQFGATENRHTDLEFLRCHVLHNNNNNNRASANGVSQRLQNVCQMCSLVFTCSTFFNSAMTNASTSAVSNSLSIFFNLACRYFKHLSRVSSSPPLICENCNSHNKQVN